MAYIQGEGRDQGTLFPVTLDDLVPADHVCRVVDAFVGRLVTSELGFERAQAAETGRPGYNPRDLLKLYLYGYLNQIRSSRRLEAECRRNVELMWLLGRLYPDHKSIAEFRRMHRDAVTAAGAELILFARGCGLIRGEWIAIDGSKFRAVASIDSTRERLALQRYLDSIEKADEEQQAAIDPSAVQAALDKLKQHPEPEAGFMLMRQNTLPAYNVQTAVDTEYALIVAQTVVLDAADSRCLQPMAEAAKRALAVDSFQIVADAGYSNGEQAAQCEAAGMLPLFPGEAGPENDPNWSPDGRKIVFATSREAGDDPKSVICILELDSNHVTTLPGSVGMYSPRWSPDGHAIVTLAPPSPHISRVAWKAKLIFLSPPMASGQASEVYSCRKFNRSTRATSPGGAWFKRVTFRQMSSKSSRTTSPFSGWQRAISSVI
jgi:transposase